MTNLTQSINFSGKTINVGMDVHKKNWNITLYYEQQYLKKFQQPANPNILIQHLKENYPGANFKLAYESGFCGFWIQRSLASAGFECIVVNAADVPQTDKDFRRKNDITDSYRIGRALSCGMLKPIYIPDPKIECDRALVRYRHRLNKDLRRSKVRIRSLLNHFGISVPDRFNNSRWTNPFIGWLKELKIEESSLRITLNRMVEQVEILRQKILEVTRDIRKMINSDSYSHQAKLLMSTPGIGLLTAISFLTEIGSIKRFGSFYQLNSFIGFCPTEFSSGEKEQIGSITPRHHPLLRSLLIESAWTAVRLDPALTLAFNEYTKRMTAKRAIIRIARKLLHRIYCLLNKEQLYVKGVV
jgi:transposase